MRCEERKGTAAYEFVNRVSLPPATGRRCAGGGKGLVDVKFKRSSFASDWPHLAGIRVICITESFYVYRDMGVNSEGNFLAWKPARKPAWDSNLILWHVYTTHFLKFPHCNFGLKTSMKNDMNSSWFSCQFFFLRNGHHVYLFRAGFESLKIISKCIIKEVSGFATPVALVKVSVAKSN